MKRGRKSKHEDWISPDGLIRIQGWARDGLTDKQIAELKMGIGETTFSTWKRKFPEIREALKKGKEPVDIEVENALLKSALGYITTVKKAVKLRTKKQLKDKGTIEEERVEYIDEEIYIPASTTAQIFWLKNRRPDKWRDRQEKIITSVEDLTPLAEMINATDDNDRLETTISET